jgi:SNF family Na+-dependent transporter
VRVTAVFEVIPEALALMPAKELFCVLFFVMLLMLGLTVYIRSELGLTI